jgi:hypothetical protein
MGELKKVDESTLVAFYDDDRVGEAGFYTLKGEAETGLVQAYRATKTVTVQSNDDAGKPFGDEWEFVVTDEADGEPFETEHHTNMEPDKRVWPSPDGEGWVTEDPKKDDPASEATPPAGVTVITKKSGSRGDS